MKKTNLIEVLLEKSELSKADAKFGVDYILTLLTQGIAAADGVEIRGFGSFHKKRRKARLAFNPKTGNSMQIEERFTSFFKPGKSLREAVNKVNTKNF